MKPAPIYTVFSNVENDEGWVGMQWEFFTTYEAADRCYEEHAKAGHVVTKRLFHENDRQHMGAAHR